MADLPDGYTEEPIAQDAAPAQSAPAASDLPQGFTEVPIDQHFTQSLTAPEPGSIDPTSVVGAQNPDQWAGRSGMGTSLIASLQPDVQKKIKVYADARGLPVERYGVDGDGNIIYIDSDNKTKMEEPTIAGGSFLSNPIDFLARIAHQITGNAGQAVPMAGGAAGEAIAGPIGAVAGGAAGDLVRQEAGNLISGFSPKDVSISNAVGQGAIAGTGSLLGNFAPRIANAGLNAGRNTMYVGSEDLGTLADPANQAIYAQRAADATAQGIPLTPGNVTGAKSLTARERQLGRYPESTDIMGNFLTNRNEEAIPTAVSGTISTQFPGATGHVQGAYDMQNGAQAVLESLDNHRTAIASPSYLRAFSSGAVPDVAPTLEMINRRLASGDLSPTLQNVLEEARGQIAEETPVLNASGEAVRDPATGRPQTEWTPLDNYARLHNGKMEMDGIIQALANKSPAPNIVKSAQAELTPVQQSLTQALRDAHPAYERGYQDYIAASAPIDQARQGLVGLMANPSRVRNFSNVPDIIGSGGDPTSIAAARDLFHSNGQGPAWDSGIASYLQNGLEKAQRVTQAGSPNNVAGKFYQSMFGDGPLRDNLQAATTPQQYTAMERLFNSLRLAANSPAEGSATATDVGAKKQLASGWAKVLGTVVGGLNPLEWPDKAAGYIINRSAQRNAANLANVFTNQDSINELLRLRSLSPGSAASLNAVTNALTKAGFQIESTRSNAPPQSPKPVPILQNFARPAAATAP